MKTNFYFLFACCLFYNLEVVSQVSIQPLVPQSGLVQKTQLWNLSVTCLSVPNDQVFTIELVLTDRLTNQSFLTADVQAIELKNGVQMFTETSLGSISYNYGSSSMNWQSSGFLPAGLYKACYNISPKGGESNLSTSECILIDVEPMAPPLLTFPLDSAILSNFYPQFLWMPPVPLVIFNELQYDLNIAEILPGQSALEAVQNNMPVYAANSLTQNAQAYNSTFARLDTGKFYVWQVIARNGPAYGAKSEAWVFRIQQPVDTIPSTNAMFMVLSGSNEPDGAYTLKGRTLYIKYHSYESDHTAAIRIMKTGEELVKETTQRIVYGENYFTVKINSGELNNDQLYTLELKDKQGKLYSARFSITQD